MDLFSVCELFYHQEFLDRISADDMLVENAFYILRLYFLIEDITGMYYQDRSLRAESLATGLDDLNLILLTRCVDEFVELFDDFHASRVLPGFKPDSKLQMLLNLKDHAEIVIVISAGDIESNKIRGDYGITYDSDVLRLMDAFASAGLFVYSLTKTTLQSSRCGGYGDLLQTRC